MLNTANVINLKNEFLVPLTSPPTGHEGATETKPSTRERQNHVHGLDFNFSKTNLIDLYSITVVVTHFARSNKLYKITYFFSNLSSTKFYTQEINGTLQG